MCVLSNVSLKIDPNTELLLFAGAASHYDLPLSELLVKHKVLRITMHGGTAISAPQLHMPLCSLAPFRWPSTKWISPSSGLDPWHS